MFFYYSLYAPCYCFNFFLYIRLSLAEGRDDFYHFPQFLLSSFEAVNKVRKSLRNVAKATMRVYRGTGGGDEVPRFPTLAVYDDVLRLCTGFKSRDIVPGLLLIIFHLLELHFLPISAAVILS